MKLYRNAIILVVVLGLLIGTYVVVKNKKDTGMDEGSESKIEKILDLDSTKIAEVTVENKDEKLVIVKKDKEWELALPAGLKADKSILSSIAINASTIIADKVIEENASDLSVYGLDKPVIVTIKMDDGKQEAIFVGNETPTKDGYYLKMKDTNKIYTIGSYTAEKLIVGKNDIRDKKLFTFTIEDTTAFSMDRAGENVFTAKKVSDAEWTITAPIEANINAGEISTMLDAIANSYVSEFVDENAADLGKYGLDNPSYALEVEVSGTKIKLLLGAEKDSMFYAKLADSNDVFTISSSAYTFIDKPLKEIMEVFAYIVNIQDVNKIEVQMDGETVVSEIQTDKDDSDKDKFFVNGKDATVKDESDNQLFRKYYQALIGVTLSDLEIGANPVGNPEITFTYYIKKEPEKVTVKFIRKDDRYYYVLRNDKYTGMIVDKDKFYGTEGVKETYDKLIEAMNKK